MGGHEGHPFGALVNNEIRRVMLRLIILRKISEKRTYSYEIVKQLSAYPQRKAFGNRARFKNTVYNTIAGLHRDGYIAAQRSRSGKVAKVYFTLTPKGRKALSEARKAFGTAISSMRRILE
jgi:DNA-binding PadR family transcriptional regulator